MNQALPDIDEKYEPIQRGAAAASQQVDKEKEKEDIGKMMYERMAAKRKVVDPMLEPTGDEPDKWDKDYNEKTEAMFTPVHANAHGTRYHNESKTAKFWYEAKNDGGVSHNVTSGEGRWETPHNGFVSTAEQQKLKDKKTEKTVKKMRVQAENQGNQSSKLFDLITLSGHPLTIYKNDLDSLQERTYVTEGAVEYYLDVIFQEMDGQIRKDIHVLSSAIFPTLNHRLEKGIERPLKITENIFNKKFVIIPICHQNHWIIAVATRFRH